MTGDNKTLRVFAVLNRDGGILRTTDIDGLSGILRHDFGSQWHDISICSVAGKDVEKALADAADDEAGDVILAGGGDGTVSAAAATCWKSGKALGVLPAGTMNLYARTLQVPLEIEAAVQALAAGRLARADIATANGRPFIHQFSVGMQSRMVREREKLEYSSRLGKILANIRAMTTLITRPPSFPAIIEADGALASGNRSLVAISNNPHGPGHLPYADTIDAGKLGIYQVPELSASEAAGIASDLAIGSWERNALLEWSLASQVKLQFPRRKSGDHAVIDGELVDLEEHVEIDIRPGELKVLLPKPSDPSPASP